MSSSPITVDVLDRLVGIRIRNFEETDVTPSSETASLPTSLATPQLDCTDISEVGIIQDSHHSTWPSMSYQEEAIEAPGAPLLRDYDSFTEGSAKGSFESIAAASWNEHGEPIYPITSINLEPNWVDDTSHFIEEWREQVSMIAAPPTDTLIDERPQNTHKRARSPSVDGEGERRTRARSRSLSNPPTLFGNAFDWDAAPIIPVIDPPILAANHSAPD